MYKSSATGNKWTRIKGSLRFQKEKETSELVQIFFEHGVEANEDKIFFAFTYPYTYTVLQSELAEIDNSFKSSSSSSSGQNSEDIYYKRELVTESCDRRRIDLLTITSLEGKSSTGELEPLLSGLFPDSKASSRPLVFPKKEVVFVSARVHAGEGSEYKPFKD